MELTGLFQCASQPFAVQARRVERSGATLTTKRNAAVRGGGLCRTELRRLTCNAAAETEVADAKDIEAALAGEQASPKDPAGKPILGESGSAQPERRNRGGDRRNRGPRREVKYQIADLKVGELYEGTVTKVTEYGGFVDIGAPRPGLLHISQLAEGRTEDASKVIKVGDKLKARIRRIELDKDQFSLTLLDQVPRRSAEGENGAGESAGGSRGRGRGPRGGGRGRGAGGGRGRAQQSQPLPDVNVGQKVTGKIVRVERFGVFVSLKEDTKAVLLPAREISEQDRPPAELNYTEGQEVTAYVQDVDKAKQNVRLTLMTPEEQAMEKQIAQKGVQATAGSRRKVAATNGKSLLGAALLKAGLSSSKAEPEPVAEPSPAAAAAEPEIPQSEPDVKAVEPEAEMEEVPAPAQAEPAAAAVEPQAAVAEPEAPASLPEPEPAAEPSPAAAIAEPEAHVKVPEPEIAASTPEVKPEPVAEPSAAPAAEVAPAQAPIADGDASAASQEVAEAARAAEEPSAASEPKVPEPAQAEAAPAPAKAAPAPAAEAKKSKAAAAPAGNGAISASAVIGLREKTGAGMMDCKKALKETGGDVEAAIDFLRKKGLAGAEKKAGRTTTEGLIASYIHAGSGLGVLLEVNCETDFVARGDVFKGLCSDLAMQIAAFGEVVAVSADHIPPEVLDKEREIEMGKDDILSKPEDKRAMIVEGRIAKTKKRMSLMEQPYIKDNNKTVETFIKETIAQLGENISVRRFERFVLGEGIKKKEADLAKDVEEQTKKMQEAAAAKAAEGPKEEAPPEPTEEQVQSLQVSAKVVKELRQTSGAGMMDCKRALAACDGDMEKAADYLRKKGLASADKKAGRVASEGAIASYIHGGRLGVMVEVNCETDFVARGDVFQTLAADVAMQIASNPQVVSVTKEEFPAEELERERKIAMEMDDLKGKPDNIREKIVEGRVGKIAGERALMEQPYIKDPKKILAQHIKETIAALGENITVRRFARFNLGEGLAKKEDNFAEEVAKATGGS